MRLSSGSGLCVSVGLPCGRQCVEDVDAAAWERGYGLMVSLSLAGFGGGERSAGGVVERAEGGLVEDAFAGLVAAVCSSRVADFAGLFEDRRESGRGREPVGCREAADATCLGDELGGERRPHAGQAGGEGGGGVAAGRLPGL